MKTDKRAPLATLDGQQELAAKLPIIEYELRKHGLYLTAMAVRKAVQMIGYEMSGDETVAQRMLEEGFKT